MKVTDNRPILITGSEGLIGKKLSEKLCALGYQIIGFDCRAPTSDSYGEVLDPIALNEQITHCGGIVHLAAVSRVVWGQQDPIRCHLVNVLGTQKLLKICLESSHKPWVIFASSREVYGQQEQFPVSEFSSLKPMNYYAHSKCEGEKLVVQARECGLTAAILRFSNVYGSIDDHPDRVIPAFCQAAIDGSSMRVDGPNHLFDFTHVSDVVNGIINVIQQIEDNLPPIHFTTGIGCSLYELASFINSSCGNRAEILQGKARSYDVEKFIGDPTRAFQLLGWKPHISMAAGIEQLLNDYKKIRAAV